nr:AAA family ATPase [Kribbella antibiotica]
MRARSPVTVGRDHELLQIRTAVEQATARQGRALFVTGEAGIGKTRLGAVAAGVAAELDVPVLRGRAGTLGAAMPLRPFSEALAAHLRDGHDHVLEQLGGYREVLTRLVPGLSETGQVRRQLSIAVLAEAILRFLAELGRDRGCLLVLDDLHAADAETLAVVDYLVDNLVGQPVLILGTLRSQTGPALELATAAQGRGVAEILELYRLPQEQTAELAAGMLDVPAGEIPAAVLEQLWSSSAGVPFVVEEVLREFAHSGQLVASPAGWQALGELRAGVPAAVVHSVGSRTSSLGARSRQLLSVAAVLGPRFSLRVVETATEADQREMVTTLRAGIAAQLVTADVPAPDWYAFRHPLTAEALLAQLTNIERAEYSRQAAEAIESLHPQLEDDWCALAASLRMASGETDRAAVLFAQAGQRAYQAGALQSAVQLFHQALDAGIATPAARADLIAALLVAQRAAGRFERLDDVQDALEKLRADSLPGPRLATLYAYLAVNRNDLSAHELALAHLATARELLGDRAGDAETAPVDVSAAAIVLNQPGPDRLQRGIALARRAADAAARVPLPEIACEAWQWLGILARPYDLDEAYGYFDQAERFATTYQLPTEVIQSQVLKAGITFLADGRRTELEAVQARALIAGAIPMAVGLSGTIALQRVMSGDYQAAAQILTTELATATRIKLGHVESYLQVVQAVLAAHQGRRAEMEAALIAHEPTAGNGPFGLSYSLGLARSFCSLLHEERGRAEDELARVVAFEADNPTTMHLSGPGGMALLLGVLAGRLRQEHLNAATERPTGTLRWNLQFVRLAEAVLHGRAGQTERAAESLAQAQEASALFPMARHLGHRLVAPEAIEHGWGDPAQLLEAAERYFHDHGVPAPARACRRLLKDLGVPVRRRRENHDRVPADLRSLGVSVREFEVLDQLAVYGGSNRAIAERLFISPRTLEKHVASLITKTAQADRTALRRYAERLLSLEQDI